MIIEQAGTEVGSDREDMATGQRVLVVDDSSFFRKLIQDVLVQAGYSVEVAPDGETALEQVRKNPPQLLVTDLVMPEMNGLDLLRRIREEWSAKQLPVLVVTEQLLRDADVQELERLGCKGTVNKFAPPDHIVFRANAALFSLEQNARQNTRVPVSVPVQLRVGTSASFVYSYNLSKDGMYVRSTDPPPTGTIVEVSFALPDRSRYLRVQAKVMHAQRRGAAVGVPPGFGLRFENLDEADAAALADFVQKSFESGP